WPPSGQSDVDAFTRRALILNVVVETELDVMKQIAQPLLSRLDLLTESGSFIYCNTPYQFFRSCKGALFSKMARAQLPYCTLFSECLLETESCWIFDIREKAFEVLLERFVDCFYLSLR